MNRQPTITGLLAQIAFDLCMILAKLALQALAVFIGVAAALHYFGG